MPEGLDERVREELRAYGTPLLTEERPFPSLPLDDEPQLEAWTRYAAEAGRSGAFEALAMVFPQLRYPIARGISETDGYRAATRRGETADDDAATGLGMARPDRVRLELAPTIAGRIPILVAEERADFESLVRALSARNEPVDVPPSMGACLVRGLNDWDRIRTYRREWEAENAFGDWPGEFRSLVARKELYEDRFIILSTGPYSGVPAERAGFAEDDWRALSLSIRREHEATHYFTLRAAGTMRNNLVDELVADWVGLVRTFGRYRKDLALLFFGLEDYPAYREGARLQNYRGTLSDAAFDAAKALAHGAVENLARLDLTHPARGETGIAAIALALASSSLEELASADLTARAGRAAESARVTAVDASGDGHGLEVAREALGAFSERHGVSENTQSALELVLDEVLSNVARHGYGGALTRPIGLELSAPAGNVRLEIVDDGFPFDALARKDPDTTRPLAERQIGGLGIFLVKKVTDSQRYERTGATNRFVVTKRISS